MRILNTELLVPTAEEIRNLVLMAYDAGRTRGREEARLELRGLWNHLLHPPFHPISPMTGPSLVRRARSSALDARPLRWCQSDDAR